MIGNVVEQVREIAKGIAPDAVFEVDEPRMMNVKIDSVSGKAVVSQGGVDTEVNSSFIYLEEPTYGYYDIPYRGFEKQRTFLRLYFCKFEEMHNSAYKGDSKYSGEADKPGHRYRIPLRDEIEQTMVRPFLYRLKNSELVKRYPEMLASVRVLYPRARFDANEVSVGLEIMFMENFCLTNYKI